MNPLPLNALLIINREYFVLSTILSIRTISIYEKKDVNYGTISLNAKFWPKCVDW